MNLFGVSTNFMETTIRINGFEQSLNGFVLKSLDDLKKFQVPSGLIQLLKRLVDESEKVT